MRGSDSSQMPAQLQDQVECVTRSTNAAKNCSNFSRIPTHHLGLFPSDGDLLKQFGLLRKKIPKNHEQLRSVSLLSVKGKNFLSVLSWQRTDFLQKNNCVNTSVQKGGNLEMPGSLGHTGAVTQLIREACKGKGYLDVLWLAKCNRAKCSLRPATGK